jgi:hypothetical protein
VRFRVEIPMLPPVECNPNVSVQARDRFKLECFAYIVSARNRVGAYIASGAFYSIPVEIKWTLVYADHQRRDRDKALAMLKPVQAALVDAKLIEDDDRYHVTRVSVHIEIDKRRAPLTICEIIPSVM